MNFKLKYLVLIIFYPAQVNGQLLKLKEKITGSDKTSVISKEIKPGSPMAFNSSPYKTITTVAGSGIESRASSSEGKEDGLGKEARFYKPNDIINDGKGGFLIADFLNFRIRKMTTEYKVSTIAGSSQGQEDGNLSEGRLYSPVALCLDKNGDIIVADKNYNAIRKITRTGIETIAGGNGNGFEDGDAKTAQFNRPIGVVVNSKNEIFVCDEGNHRIRKISGNTVSTYAGNGNGGYADGPATTADFLYPKSIAIDNSDNIYVAENTMIRKISPDGMVTTLAGREGVQGRRDGKGSNASFSMLTDMVVGSSGNLFVVDVGGTDALSNDHETNLRYRNGGSAIRIVSPDGTVQTVAGSYLCSQSERYYESEEGKQLNDGPVSKAFLSREVFGICLDKDENIYVTDAWFSCIRVISK
jgi:hypothetical protein